MHTSALAEVPAAAADADLVRRDLRAVLDGEVARLPERYRRPLILCYFEGKTHEEAARLLGCPKGTLAARLARGRERLRPRLIRRGLALSSAMLAGVLAEQTLAAAVPARLAQAAVGAARTYLTCQSAAGLCSANAVSLAEGVLHMMWYAKMKMVGSLILALLVAGTGVGVGMRYGWTGTQAADPPAAQTAPQPPARKPTPPSELKAKNTRRINDPEELSDVGKVRLDVMKLKKKLDAVLKEIKELKGGQPATSVGAHVAPDSDLQVVHLRLANVASVVNVLLHTFGKRTLRVVPVPDTNALLIGSSEPAELRRVQKLIRDVLDVRTPDRTLEPQTWLIGPLKGARSADVAKLVRQLYGTAPGLSVAVEDRSNIVALVCSKPRYDEVCKLVQSLEKAALDLPPTPPTGARLVRLKHIPAAHLSKILHEIYRNEKSAVFATDTRTNQLVLRCPPALETEIVSLIRELDIPEAGGK